MPEALKPCPFCGNCDNDIVDDRWMCNCCMAEGPPSRVDPARAWNRRAPDPSELLALVYQYRNDLLYPVSEDSRVRRLAAIDAALAKVGRV